MNNFMPINSLIGKMSIFLNRHKLPMLTQKEIQNINGPRAINNTKFAARNHATRVTPT